jgi:hypothetical protein
MQPAFEVAMQCDTGEARWVNGSRSWHKAVDGLQKSHVNSSERTPSFALRSTRHQACNTPRY